MAESPAEELRAAAKRIRSDAAWPTEEFSHAVADWLDERIRDWDENVTDTDVHCHRWHRGGCGGPVWQCPQCQPWCQCFDSAFAVARAYPAGDPR